MLKTIAFLSLSTLLASLPCTTSAFAAGLDLQWALNERVAQSKGRGGGVLRVQQGESAVLWQGASGKWGHHRGRIWPFQTFEVASITKTFTATLILQMHEDPSSPVKLWKTIGELLPASVSDGLLVVDGRDYGPEIHVRELLKHRSGLPDYWSSKRFIRAFEAQERRMWQPPELVEYAKQMTPISTPGTSWHYADTNYVLLGMIIEAATGQPLEKVLRDRILVPAGMTETYLSYRELPVSRRRESHRFEEKEDLYRKPRQSADWAGGGLVSNVVDLQKFMRALFQGRLFERPDTLDIMKRWSGSETARLRYGMGLYRIQLESGLGELWGHDGWGNAFMYYWPQRDIGFAGTLNQVDNDWWPLVAEAIDQVERSR